MESKIVGGEPQELLGIETPTWEYQGVRFALDTGPPIPVASTKNPLISGMIGFLGAGLVTSFIVQLYLMMPKQFGIITGICVALTYAWLFLFFGIQNRNAKHETARRLAARNLHPNFAGQNTANITLFSGGFVVLNDTGFLDFRDEIIHFKGTRSIFAISSSDVEKLPWFRWTKTRIQLKPVAGIPYQMICFTQQGPINAKGDDLSSAILAINSGEESSCPSVRPPLFHAIPASKRSYRLVALIYIGALTGFFVRMGFPTILDFMIQIALTEKFVVVIGVLFPVLLIWVATNGRRNECHRTFKRKMRRWKIPESSQIGAIIDQDQH